ncbi:MAG: glycerophosphodiester phosphodiesterase [Planctomycetia bacterium]|nr:glycerophosphodiester phosphodiesterase [Planctomycetia bacterium]
MPDPLLIAHRGASHDAPENTLAAFCLAFDQGADGIEGDFQLTSNRQIVCIHDETTKRTAGIDLRVAGSTLTELRKLDVGRWKGETFAGERIPTLREVLSLVPAGKLCFVEVKSGPEFVAALRDDLQSTAFDPQQLAVIAFDDRVVAAAKRDLPGVKGCLIVDYRRDANNWTPSLESILARLKSCGADGLDTEANVEVVTQDFIRRVHDEGFAVHSWTIDSPGAAAQLRAAGIDSLTTNRPAFLRASLGLSQASP